MKKTTILLFLSVGLFSFLGKSQVTLQTGAANINIPLYTISDPNNGLSVPISLQYVAGNGLKVNSVASSVGTGWDLSCGGFIERQQRGAAPDDQAPSPVSPSSSAWATPNFFPYTNGMGHLPTSVTTQMNTNITNNINYVSNYYPAGYLYNTIYKPTDDIDVSACFSYNFGVGHPVRDLPHPKILADREQDVFTFNFLGRMGQFVIGSNTDKTNTLKNNNSTLIFLNDKDSKLKVKINFDNNISTNSPNLRTTIKSFTVIDETGIQYVFEEQELTEVINYDRYDDYYENYIGSEGHSNGSFANRGNVILPFSYDDLNIWVNAWYDPIFSTSNILLNNGGLPHQKLHVFKGTQIGKYVCNKWMLSKIINPFTNNKITFQYTNETLIYEAQHQCDGTYMNQAPCTGGCYAPYSLNVTILLNSQIIKKINKIIDDNGNEVDFNYNNSSRLDLTGDGYLKSIDYLAHSNHVSTINFKYGYFLKSSMVSETYNPNDQDIPYLRLCLNSLQKVGINEKKEKPYQFSYYLGDDTYNSFRDIVPPNFCYFKNDFGSFDILGYSLYMNNKSIVKDLYGNNIGYQNAIYPYGNRVYDIIGYYLQSMKQGGVDNPDKSVTTGSTAGLICKITYPIGGTMTYSYEGNDAYYNGKNVINGGVRVSKVVLHAVESQNADKTLNYKYRLEDGLTSSGWGYEKGNHTINTNLNLSNGSNTGAMTLNVKQQFSQVANEAISMFTNIKMYILGVAWDVISSWFPKATTSSIFDIGTTNMNQSLNSINPLPQYYSRVVLITKIDDIPVGNDIFIFTSNSSVMPNADFSILVPEITYNQNQLYDLKQRYKNWVYGLPLSIENDDKNGNLIKKIDYSYKENTRQQTLDNNNFTSQFWRIKRCFVNGIAWSPANYSYYALDADNTYTSGTPDNNNTIQKYLYTPLSAYSSNILTDTYTPLFGSISVDNTIEYFNKPQNTDPTKYVSHSTATTYNTNFLPASKTSLNSKGETVETDYKYTSDYDITGSAINTLKDNNCIARPVLTETYVTRNGIKYLVSGNIIEYGEIPNGDIKPIKIYEFRNDKPVDNTTIAAFDKTKLIRDKSYYKLSSELFYDNNGSLIQVQKDFKLAATICDQDKPEQVIATATNAIKNDIAYTSFETAVDPSGWIYDSKMVLNNNPNNIGVINTSQSITGNSSFQTSSNLATVLFKTGLNSSTKYRVTFWAKALNGIPISVWVNGVKPAILYTNPVNNWVLYEANIFPDTKNNANSITIQNHDGSSGSNFYSFLIDEVRIYPAKTAQMKTITYNVLGLKSCEVDANDKITYYEYDGLGRLVLLRDGERNVLKTYEYHTKN